MKSTLALVVLVAATFTARAHEPAECADLTEIRHALERLLALHAVDERRQQIELLMKRVELSMRQLSPLESKLSEAENDVRSIEEQLLSVERMRAQTEQQLDLDVREGVDVPRSETRGTLQGLERTQIGLEDALKDARLRMQQHENELARGRKKIAILEEKLDEMLADVEL